MLVNTECEKGKLMDMLSEDICASAAYEELPDTTLILLSPTNYSLLLASSELMGCTFKKMKNKKTNFILYPSMKDSV